MLLMLYRMFKARLGYVRHPVLKDYVIIGGVEEEDERNGMREEGEEL